MAPQRYPCTTQFTAIYLFDQTETLIPASQWTMIPFRTKGHCLQMRTRTMSHIGQGITTMEKSTPIQTSSAFQVSRNCILSGNLPYASLIISVLCRVLSIIQSGDVLFIHCPRLRDGYTRVIPPQWRTKTNGASSFQQLGREERGFVSWVENSCVV